MQRREFIQTAGVGVAALAALDGQALQTLGEEPPNKNELKLGIGEGRYWLITSPGSSDPKKPLYFHQSLDGILTAYRHDKKEMYRPEDVGNKFNSLHFRKWRSSQIETSLYEVNPLRWVYSLKIVTEWKPMTHRLTIDEHRQWEITVFPHTDKPMTPWVFEDKKLIVGEDDNQQIYRHRVCGELFTLDSNWSPGWTYIMKSVKNSGYSLKIVITDKNHA